MLAILVLARRMAEGPRETGVHLDLVGTALSALGLGLIVFAILRSGTWGFVKPKPGAPEWIGLSPVIWLMLGGGVVIWLFMQWENRLLARGGEPLIDPAILRVPVLRGGLTSFFFQFFVQGGLFFAVPLFLSVALGLSAIETGVRLLPLSITLILAAAGIPKLFPHASPRRVVRLGFIALFAGLVVMVAPLEAGAGPEIMTWPMLLAGLGDRGAGLAARERHRLIGLRRAERRGRRAAEHDHEPRHLHRHRAHGRDRHRRADHLVPDRRPAESRRSRPRQIAGHDPARRWRPVHLRRAIEDRARQGPRATQDRRCHRRRERDSAPRRAARRRCRCSPSSR